MVRLFTYLTSGLFTEKSITMSILLIPAMVLGSIIGMNLHRRVNEDMFKKYTLILLFIVGISLFVS